MDRQRLEQALVAADAAGDVEAATQLAAALREMTQPAAPPPVTGNDRALAATAGGYSGIASMLGLPVDTALNVWDLAKAGTGYVQGEITGKAPSGVFDQTDRSQWFGSSQWIKNRMGDAGAVTEAPRQDDPASRWIKAGSEFGTGMYLGSALPTPKTQPPLRPTSDWTMPGYGAKDLVRGRANANIDAGSGNAGAQATASGSLNTSVRGGGYNFGSVGDDAASSLTPGQQSAARNFPQGRLTPGQATGNKLLQRLEAKLESQPMTAGPFDRIKDSNAKEVNRAVAKAIGENADNLSAEVLDRAVTRMGAVFDDVRDGAQRTIDPKEFTARMRAVGDEFEAIGPQVWQHPLVDRLIRHAKQGSATGKDLGGLASKLTRESHRQMTSPQGDRELGRALGQVKEYVDDLVEQGLSKDRLSRYQAAREQYRNLSLLTSRVGAINPSTGNVNGSLLANALQQKDRAGFLFGRNKSDMYNAARFAQAHRPFVGDSGTATRMPLPSPTDFVVSLPFNLATRAYASSPSVKAALTAQALTQRMGDALPPVGDPTYQALLAYALQNQPQQ